jgi:hypothetical protein
MLGALLTPALPFAVPSGEVFRARIWGLGGRPVGKFTVLASIMLGPATSADDVAPPIGRAASDAQAIFCRRRHQPRRPRRRWERERSANQSKSVLTVGKASTLVARRGREALRRRAYDGVAPRREDQRTRLLGPEVPRLRWARAQAHQE